MVKEPGSLHPTHTQEAMIDTTQSVPIGFPSEGENMEAAEVGHSMLSSDLGAYLQSFFQENADFQVKMSFHLEISVDLILIWISLFTFSANHNLLFLLDPMHIGVGFGTCMYMYLVTSLLHIGITWIK